MNNDLHLKKAKPADAALISSMAEGIWRDHYTPLIGEEQVSYMLNKMYSVESLHQQMNEGYVFHIAYEGERPIGYISIGEKTSGNYFLSKFYMETGEQGKGYGKKIFELVLREFPPMKTMRLQVNRQNFKSVNFYFRLGFFIEEVKDFDIGDGYVMDDFVMLKRFDNVQ